MEKITESDTYLPERTSDHATRIHATVRQFLAVELGGTLGGAVNGIVDGSAA